ncbi:VanZ family protein [Vibrio sp. S9_S30]|uniref:VanZ family protein n=1 Tax=Vibrio sp. S9_S30 TaxID=2720226 RepID=UPI00167FE502|nr:VanZ family protein [Vibrio sp. S9_S30]MBD1556201.1 VanZ family protein [Vibrio sp. S9_S30]
MTTMKELNTQTHRSNLGQQSLVIGLFFSCILLVGSLSVMQSIGLLTGELRYAIQYYDLVVHFSLAAILGLTASLASKIAGKPFLSFLLVLMLIDEFSQIWIPSRQFSWVDLASNIFGCLSGVLLLQFSFFISKALSHQHSG